MRSIVQVFVVIFVALHFLGVFSHNSYGAPYFYNEKEGGWYRFFSAILNNGKKDAAEELPLGKKSIKEERREAVEKLKKYQLDLEEKQAAMVINPSLENARAYIKKQNESFVRAAAVSQSWRDAMMMYPELNLARDLPISDVGNRIQKQLEMENQQKMLNELSKHVVLIFAFSKSCSYCKAFSEVLNILVQRYGFKIKIVSAEKMGVSTVPALFCYYKEKILPLSQGYLTIDQLESNLIHFMRFLKK